MSDHHHDNKDIMSVVAVDDDADDDEDDDEEDYGEGEEFLEDEGEFSLTQPVLVGYAFGPKKMSTMGVVMAEASKAKLSTTTVIRARRVSTNNEDTTNAAGTAMSSLTTAALSSHDMEKGGCCSEGPADDSVLPGKQHKKKEKKDTIIFSMDGHYSRNSGFRNVVRHFRSSCSSVGDDDVTSTSSTNMTTRTLSSIKTTSTSLRSPSHHTPIRVSFVPLDPDVPLEEQHGGKMDIILHKLTEDILCLSQHHQSNHIDDKTKATTDAAYERVHRLSQYAKDHPECCLVDDPWRVKTLMSRSDIAHVLADCLVGVTSSSGRKVHCPKFVVMQQASQRQESHAVSYPVIVKPLTAAGTKASHRMAVLLDPSAWKSSEDVLRKSYLPCLLQEYANHNSVLYKVYVLGDNVSVYRRPSLPNLPAGGSNCVTFVEFDSQRPYPKLSDFGVDSSSAKNKTPAAPYNHEINQNNRMGTAALITSEEVLPIVNTLKRAFGLEMFGFDILLEDGTGNMMVVDVNYFPSYKEVPNFPSLLAQYLTQRAFESRAASR